MIMIMMRILASSHDDKVPPGRDCGNSDDVSPTWSVWFPSGDHTPARQQIHGTILLPNLIPAVAAVASEAHPSAVEYHGRPRERLNGNDDRGLSLRGRPRVCLGRPDRWVGRRLRRCVSNDAADDHVERRTRSNSKGNNNNNKTIKLSDVQCACRQAIIINNNKHHQLACHPSPSVRSVFHPSLFLSPVVNFFSLSLFTPF